MTLEQATAALAVLTKQMNADELELLGLVALKIVNGSAKHGPMQLDTDTRDFDVEMQAERIDLALYGYMDQIRRDRRKAKVEQDQAAIREMGAKLRALADSETYSPAPTFEGKAP